MKTDPPERLVRLVTEYREILENEWDWHGDRACFGGMCHSVSDDLAWGPRGLVAAAPPFRFVL